MLPRRQRPGDIPDFATGTVVGTLAVNYTIAAGTGRAASGDYTPALTGVVTIPSGQSFVDITITPVDDADSKVSETLMLTLFDTGVTMSAASVATVTIATTIRPIRRLPAGRPIRR